MISIDSFVMIDGMFIRVDVLIEIEETVGDTWDGIWGTVGSWL